MAAKSKLRKCFEGYLISADVVQLFVFNSIINESLKVKILFGQIILALKPFTPKDRNVKPSIYQAVMNFNIFPRLSPFQICVDALF